MKQNRIATTLITSVLFLAALGSAALVPSPAQARGSAGPEAPAGVTNYPVYLPMVARNLFAGESPFGIAMYGGVNAASGLDHMQAAGSRWVTAFLIWNQVEPNAPGIGGHTYNWSSLDTKAAAVQAAGMQLFILVTQNPAWAATYPGGPVNNVADLVAFMAAAVERYDGDGVSDAPGGPRIDYWSLYAEPDNGAEWAALQGKGYWGHNGAGYADMLAQVSPAIRAANPRAKVLIGGLAYDSFESEGGIFVQSFLGDTLAALNTKPGGAANYIDAVGFHFYPISTARWPGIKEKALEIRGILDQHGVGQLDLTSPEMGYWVDPANGSSVDIQAKTLVKMYVQGLSVGLTQMSWFEVFDAGTGMESHGLFANNDLNQPRPAYHAYATLTAELTGAAYLRPFSGAGVEGYVFRLPTGAEETVVWATGASARADLPLACGRSVDRLGTLTIVADGSPADADGAANGRIGLNLGSTAVLFVRPC